jgi:hypothetical protein
MKYEQGLCAGSPLPTVCYTGLPLPVRNKRGDPSQGGYLFLLLSYQRAPPGPALQDPTASAPHRAPQAACPGLDQRVAPPPAREPGQAGRSPAAALAWPPGAKEPKAHPGRR